MKYYGMTYNRYRDMISKAKKASEIFMDCSDKFEALKIANNQWNNDALNNGDSNKDDVNKESRLLVVVREFEPSDESPTDKTTAFFQFTSYKICDSFRENFIWSTDENKIWMGDCKLMG